MALIDASEAINSDLEAEEVFQKIANHAARVLNAEGASVILCDPQRNDLVFKAVVGPAGQPLVGHRFDAGLGIAGQTIRTGRPVRIDDVQENRNFFSGIDHQTGIRTRSMMAAPLSRHRQIVGVVEVINPQGRRHFDDFDLDLLALFANLAAAAVSNAQAFSVLAKENQALRVARAEPQIVGQSLALQEMLGLCKRVAATNATVLLTGETGTGKEVAARAIHGMSHRQDRPFVALNCAALPESLLESELFGHEKGAFTGATEQRAGRFELAEGGTVFLDEVGETSMSIQAKLLRVLQEREYVRIGGTRTLFCDVRVIAATNRDLTREIAAGRFREDLYYRLNVFPICTPPLRSRIDDLPMLVDHFIQQLAPELGIRPPTISQDALSCMMQYTWPGNIRELRNVVERCTLLAEDEITSDVLPAGIATPVNPDSDQAPQEEPTHPASTGSKLAQQERALILKILDETDWNQSEAARRLNVSRDRLRYRMKKYNFTRPQ